MKFLWAETELRQTKYPAMLAKSVLWRKAQLQFVGFFPVKVIQVHSCGFRAVNVAVCHHCGHLYSGKEKDVFLHFYETCVSSVLLFFNVNLVRRNILKSSLKTKDLYLYCMGGS